MKRYKFGSSMQSRLLMPLIGLLILFSLIFTYLTNQFKDEYETSSKQVAASSAINQHTFDVTRIRARMQEVLLLHRITRSKKYIAELKELDALRAMHLDRIQSYGSADPNLYAQSTSIISGLKESEFLQNEMIQAIEKNDIIKADSAFQQLSTIFEINSARLRDLSVRSQNELNNDQAGLQKLLVEAFWMMTFAFILIVIAILAIAIFYRRDVIKPLRKLQEGIQSLSRGDMDVTIPMSKSPTEIRSIAADFNRMASALSKSQRDLVVAREAALAAAQIKSDFLSNMSHEIRTPMNTIIGMADLLSEGSLPAEKTKYVQVLRKSSTILLNIVNDILDYSRLEQGITTFEILPFDFRELTSRTSEAMEVVAKQKGLHFKFNFTPDEPCWIQGDPKRFEQIIINLLGNAIKFTENGSVDFSIDIQQSLLHVDKVLIQLKVIDTGIGIKVENLEKIFTRFSQSDSSITRKYGGTGLGLAIVQQLCNIMNVNINVTSELNKGSQFTLTTEVQKAKMQLSADENIVAQIESLNRMALSLPALKILLVDDVVDNRLLIDIYFKSTKCIITEAENGEKAVALFAQQPFDLILMDMQMPIMDGYVATAQIRKIEKSNNLQRSSIVALTAYALKEEIERSYKAGCDAHLTKPVRKIALFQLIEHLINSEHSNST